MKVLRFSRLILLTVVLLLVILGIVVYFGDRPNQAVESNVTIPISSFKPLNVMQISEINDAWKYSPLGAYPCPDLTSQKVYYGTHGEYIAIFEHGDVCTVQTRCIADIEMSYGYPFYIYLYKNGRFYELEDAYNNGLVSRDVVLQIAQYHNSIC